MPPIYSDDTIHTGIHDFKSNIAHYIRELDSGAYSKLILMRRGKPMAIFMTFEGKKVREKRARYEELSGLLNGSEKGLAGLLNGLTGLGGNS